MGSHEWHGWLVTVLEGERLKDRRQRGLEKKVCGWICRSEQEVELHINAQQRASTVEEILNI